jgi:hypothetical protein
MEVSCQLHAPVSLLPRKALLVPIGWEAGWAPEPLRLNQEKKTFFSDGIKKISETLEPVR